MRLTGIVVTAVLGGVALATLATPTRAQTYKQIYGFPGGRHGRGPFDSLIDYRGKLFGTVAYGGSNKCGRDGCGGIFSVDLKTDTAKIVYAFQGFSDGAYPFGNLINVGGLLYGTTSSGGTAGSGTVFSFDPSTRSKTIVYNFKGGSDGSNPYAGLLAVGGSLFGVTANGGFDNNNTGTVFSIDLATGVEKTLYIFQGGNDGNDPDGSLVNVNGTLYGATRNGGEFNLGVVFSIDATTGAETVLHSFGKPKDGITPIGSLTKVDDKIYGTTVSGGTDNQGTIFSITPASGAEKIVYSFTYSAKNVNEGSVPTGGVVDLHGTFYGITFRGGPSSNCGTNGCGTVYSYNLATRTETVLHDFLGGSDGGLPDASLVDIKGVLYGTTEGFGSGGGGTVFAVTP